MGFNPLEAIVEAAGGIFGAAFGNKADRDKAKADFKALLVSLNVGQMEVNKVEAAHRSIFVAGWRPFIGWTCGVGILYHFIIRDIIGWCLMVWAPDLPALPIFDISELMTLITGMLGLGGLRTYEKFKGVSK